MRALVAVASRHHATYEIGARIAATLTDAGLPAEVRRPGEADRLDGYDAVVLGSAIYAGQWMSSATALAKRLRAELGERPIWLFSSGPLGDPPLPAGDPPGVRAIIELVWPCGHRAFPGRIDPAEVHLAEKALLREVGAPSGDFRDWTAIDAWATEIATALRADRAERTVA
jgi:menaquinone-dependent protoporphyrinogen oxidase